MHSLKIKIETLSPLLISTSLKDSNLVSTRDFIPGTALLGIYAGKYIRKNGLNNDAHEDSTFSKWFLKGELNFLNCYITSVDSNHKESTAFPIPLSIQKEKNSDKGFELINNDDTQQVKPLGGYGILNDDSVIRLEVKKSLNFHHARDPETGTSKKGIIFNYESMDPGQVFTGFITGKKNELEGFVNTFKNDKTAYMGRSKNSQYGKVKIEILSSSPEEFVSEINSKTSVSENSEFLTMSMLSDTVIYNSNGFSITSKKALEKHLETLGIKAKVERAFFKTGRIEGFKSIWKLNRPSETCFKAGSAFLLKIDNNLKDKLSEIQRSGIGERTNEGFGRVVFGWQDVDSKRYRIIKDSAKTKISKPVVPLPESLREILAEIAKKEINRHFELKAINKVREFNSYPSKSILGRLQARIQSNCVGKEEFVKFLEGLKAKGKENLEKCRTDKTSLFQFLRDFDIAREIDDNKLGSNLLEFVEEIKFAPLQDKVLLNKVYRNYIKSFLVAMRKKTKAEEACK